MFLYERLLKIDVVQLSTANLNSLTRHLITPLAFMCQSRNQCPLNIPREKRDKICPIFNIPCDHVTEHNWNTYFRGGYDYVMESRS